VHILALFVGILFITVLNIVMADRILIKSDVDLMSWDNLSDEKIKKISRQENPLL
jgi:hypothetical protein